MLLQPRRQKRLRQAPSRVRGVIVKIVIVAIVLVLVEVAVRGCVDSVSSRAIDGDLVETGDVSVASGDIPAVVNYWILGRLSNGSITLHDISASPMNISRLKVSASDLRFDRAKMLTAKAKLNGSPPYRISMTLSGKNLSGVLDTDVVFRNGRLIAQIDGNNMDVVPTVEGRNIVLEDERTTQTVELPGKRYLPCDPTGVGSSGAGVTVTCESDTLPPYLAEAVQ